MSHLGEETKGTNVGIVGAGLIGASWAAYFQHHGLNVKVYDPSPKANAVFEDQLYKAQKDLEMIDGVSTENSVNVALCDTLKDAVADSDYVQENGPENLETKKDLLREIDLFTKESAIVGSSTSSFMCSDLQQRCENPARVIVAHPFNPPHLIPLVELGKGDQTSQAAIDTAFQFFKSIGKEPIKIKKEAVGHVANRLTAALWREAVHLVADGIATVSDVDRAICHGPGLRWAIHGPHMLYHLGGGAGGIESYIRHLGPAQEARWKALGTPTLDDETRQKIITGVHEEANGQSIRDLCNDRDLRLINMLKTFKAPSRETK